MFYPTTFFTVLLTWNNVNVRILSLLWKQFQFKLLFALCLWVIFMGAWKDSMGFCLNAEALGQACTFWTGLQKTIASIMIWHPLLLLLLIDAIIVQSNAFRLAMPLAYAFYVLANLSMGLLVSNPDPLIARDPAHSKLGSIMPPGLSPQGQINGSLVTIALMMANVVFALVRYPSGDVIFFPIKFRVKKSAVDCGQLQTHRSVTEIMKLSMPKTGVAPSNAAPYHSPLSFVPESGRSSASDGSVLVGGAD